MLVTILTDASWDQVRQVGGYGYWIASGRGKRPGGGPFRNRVFSSNQAEMQAAVNALHIALREGLVEAGDMVLFQLDNQHAIRVFGKAQKAVVQQEITIVEHLYNLAEEHELVLNFRHVKGHTNQSENRYVANAHCDRRAKKGMQEARRLINRI